MNADFYPYGVQYYRFPTPLPEEWEADLREISSIGYTHVQFHPQWRTHERIRGQFVWDDLDRLFDLAHRNSLRVGLQLMLETAPDWVFDDLGGTRIGFNGAPLSPIAIGSFYVGGWLPCFDNPAVMDAALIFVRELASRYRSRPELWFYSAWNEPRSRPLGQCQCPNSLDSYRSWLRERFGSIEELNAQFGKAWTSHRNLRPPSSGWDHAEMFLWRQWAADAVARHVERVCEAIRSVDADRIVTVHVGACGVVQDAACDSSDDMVTCACADRYGTSFPVPLHPRTPTEHSRPDLISDWLRRVDPSYWLHEFYPSHAQWSRPLDGATLSRLVWMGISGGAAAFTYWQYRSERLGNETNGYGLRNVDGSATERSGAADRIAGILKLHGSKLARSSRPPSRVGLLYSRESDVLSRVHEMQGMWAAMEDARCDYPYKQAITAAHALYLHRGETVDFVVSGDDISRLSLIHVTAAEMIDASAAGWLRDYVRSGGRLIVEFPFACRDTNTWLSPTRPNHGLADLLGCRETCRVEARRDAAQLAAFNFGGAVRAGGWMVTLEPLDAEVTAEWPDGSPAGVRRAFGDGVVCALGVNLSLSFNDEINDPAQDVLSRLLDSIGLSSETVAAKGLWLRRRRSDEYEIWFIFNTSTSPQWVELPASPREVWDETGCTIQHRTLALSPGACWVAELPLAPDCAVDGSKR